MDGASPPAEPCRFAPSKDSVLDIGPLLAAAPPYIARGSVVLGLPAAETWATSLPPYAHQPPEPVVQPPPLRRPPPNNSSNNQHTLGRANFSISSLDELLSKQEQAAELNGVASLGIISSQAGTSTSTRAGGGDQSSLSTRRDSGNISSSPEVLRPQTVFKRQPSSEDVQSDPNNSSESITVSSTAQHSIGVLRAPSGGSVSPPLALLTPGATSVTGVAGPTLEALQWSPPPLGGGNLPHRVPPPPPTGDGRSRLWSAPVSIEATVVIPPPHCPPQAVSPASLRGFNGSGGDNKAGMSSAAQVATGVYLHQQLTPTASILNAPLLPHIFSAGLIAQLRYTVDHYVKRVTPTEAERDAKRTLFNAFAEFLRRTLQDRIAISVAGSTAYEGDAKGSDLDVVLLTNLGAPLWVLQHIVNYLSATQTFHKKTGRSAWPLKDVKLQLVQSARVPLLSIATPKGLLCDVSVNTLNSVKHTEYFKRVIACKPQLRPLMRLLKYWAKVRKLPTMKEGGLPGIVWMMITVYFASCPLSTLIAITRTHEELGLSLEEEEHNNFIGQQASAVSSGGPTSVVSLLPACDEGAPLFASLIRFFFLCANRDSMSRTISVAQAICRHKSPQEVAQRVRSPNNHKGVWDEVVSIEDPATVTEASPPSEANWNPAHNAAIRFEPGSTFDLAAKISAATWLTYMLELKRGAMVLMALLRFMKESQMRVQDLPKMLATAGCPSGYPAPAVATCRGIELPEEPSIMTPSVLSQMEASASLSRRNECSGADQYIALKFRQFVGCLFEDSISDRFILPGCDETLRKAETHLVEEGSNLLLNRGYGSESSSSQDGGGVGFFSPPIPHIHYPFCICCSIPHAAFAIVLLHGRLHVLRILSVCTDWSSWWSRDFLSRRDIRSTLHGSLYRVVTPDKYCGDEHNSHSNMFFHSNLNPTGFPHFDPPALESDYRNLSMNKSPYPTLLIPVNKHDTRTPVELFFSPCHFVCRIKAWSIPPSASQPDEGYFYMETDETRYLSTLEGLLKQAPWYHYGDADSDIVFQPPPESCVRCNIEGDDLSDLKSPADYISSQGAFQPSQSIQAQQAIDAAWARWVAHTDRSRRNHEESAYAAHPLDNSSKATDVHVTQRSDSISSISSANREVVVVPQLRDATNMLVAIVDNLQKQCMSLSTREGKLKQPVTSPAAEASTESVRNTGTPLDNSNYLHKVLPVVRRTRSMPTRVNDDDQVKLIPESSAEGRVSKEATSRVGVHEKRSDLVRYVPPSKRVNIRMRGDLEDAQVKSDSTVVDVAETKPSPSQKSPMSSPPPPIIETDGWLSQQPPVDQQRHSRTGALSTSASPPPPAAPAAPPTNTTQHATTTSQAHALGNTSTTTNSAVTVNVSAQSHTSVPINSTGNEQRKRRQTRGATPTHHSAPTTPATVRGRANFTSTTTTTQPRNRRHESTVGTRSSRRHRRGSVEQAQQPLSATGVQQLQPAQQQVVSAAASASVKSSNTRVVSVRSSGAIHNPTGVGGLSSTPSSSGALDASRRLLMSALKDTFRGQPSSSSSSSTTNLDQ